MHFYSQCTLFNLKKVLTKAYNNKSKTTSKSKLYLHYLVSRNKKLQNYQLIIMYFIKILCGYKELKL